MKTVLRVIMKKTVLYLLALFALALLLSIKTQAASITDKDSGSIFTYELNKDGTYTITGAKDKPITTAVIPNKIDGKTVTAIGDEAFWFYENLSKVTIPESVSYVGRWAFKNTIWLENKQKDTPLVIINNILIDGTAATGKVVIPKTVKRISECAFSGSSMTSVTIPNSVSAIGRAAFSGCKSITKISLPSGLKEISDSLLTDCKKLTNVTLPDSVKAIGPRAFWGCNKLSKINIPSSVTNIGENAFTFCYSITKITIPSSVVKIGDGAFSRCKNLTEVVIQKGVTAIGSSAFSECAKLSKITIPATLKTIGGYAFSEKWLETKRKNNPLVTVNGILVDGKAAKGSVTIPKNVKVIADSAFIANTTLEKVTISSGTTTIGAGAFTNCRNLKSITIPSTVKKIGKSAFYNCNSKLNITVISNKNIYNTIEGVYKNTYKITAK